MCYRGRDLSRARVAHARTDAYHAIQSASISRSKLKGWERAYPVGVRGAEQGLPKGKWWLPKGGCSGCEALSALAVWKAPLAVWKALCSGRRRTGWGRRWTGIAYIGGGGDGLKYRRLQRFGAILQKQIGYGITLP